MGPLYADGFAIGAGATAVVLVVLAVVVAATKPRAAKRWVAGFLVLGLGFGGLGFSRAAYLGHEVENLKFGIAPVRFIELDQYGTRATVSSNGCTASFTVLFGYQEWELVPGTGQVEAVEGNNCPDDATALNHIFM